MFTAVIPVQNEEKSILAVLANVLRLPVGCIVPVLNGCTDRTLELIRSIPDPRIHIIYFAQSLGIDIPRAIGALYARHLGAEGVIFVDGDMSGNIFTNLEHLLRALQDGADMALTNCYPYITNRAKLTNLVLKFRSRLNHKLDLLKPLGLATPTHGPHALSAKALQDIPALAIAIPPISLVWAKQSELKIQVSTSIRHEELRSPRKHRRHARLIMETIIGDCVMGLALAQGKPVIRSLGKHELLGYHPERRFDILEQWEEAVATENRFYEQHLIIPCAPLPQECVKKS
ncbi:glycosyltransferase family 2 protein [Paradesulfitobacterium aromaticivorans]